MFGTKAKFFYYAKKIGLIDYVIPEEDIDITINKNIEYLKTSGPNAIIEIKRLIDKYDVMDIEKYKEHTVEKISELRVSSEGQEGIKAFLEKRKTKWSE